ncbi:TPA: hypothetical protein NKO75_004452 [Vibrio parahaemolyticus]|uniref:Uncharacterized protein n=1 Tax=Vibrio japonicus TaxID=1824638 RepID=A0ABY5LQZ7_9VIBR|nr:MULTISPECIES: hypothetical protein [Vibrio]TOG76296.1 hypothetical protein CGI94_22690 [Vibrio parahaemolyticus]UUM32180.1 hypothetical protein NP165_17960 [Vibrio japonicus]HCH0798994.1 hypothetical protein [Vibrio parahaemolyticus]
MKKFIFFLLLSSSFNSFASTKEFPTHDLPNFIFGWAKYAGERKACYEGWLSPSVGKDFKKAFDEGWSSIETEEQAIDFLNVVEYYSEVSDSSKACLQ